MAFLSKITYPGDGIVSSFSVPFNYIIKEHVKVYVAGVLNTTFTWTTPSTIQLASVPGIGIEVLIKRETPQTPLVAWQDGATLRAADLNKQALQTIYICQETIDNSAAAAEVGETVTLAAAQAAQSVLDAEAAVTAAEIAKTAAQAAQAATESLPKDASWITTGVFDPSRVPLAGFGGAIVDQSTGFTAAANRVYNLSGSSFTITLPVAPAAGTMVGFIVGRYASASGEYQLDAGAGAYIAGRSRYLKLIHTNCAVLRWNGSNEWVPVHLSLDTRWLDAGAVSITGAVTNPAKGTVLQDKVYWRRVGDSIEQQISFYQSVAGTAGSGEYSFRCANNYDIDTSRCASAGPAGSGCIGSAMVSNFTTSTAVGVVHAGGDPGVRVSIVNGVSGVNLSSSQAYNLGVPVAFGIHFTAPISGW